LGKEIVKMVPDRKGNRYKRKFYAGVGPDLAANAAPREGDILSLNNDMEQFEIAQFVNLFPESAEEAKALIPTLERFADKELHFYRDELTRFDRNSEGRSADRENPAKRIRVVSFANKTLESAMDEMKNISNIVPEEPRHHPTPISTQGTRQGTPATQGTPELGGIANQYDNHPFSADMNVGQCLMFRPLPLLLRRENLTKTWRLNKLQDLLACSLKCRLPDLRACTRPMHICRTCPVPHLLFHTGHHSHPWSRRMTTMMMIWWPHALRLPWPHGHRLPWLLGQRMRYNVKY